MKKILLLLTFFCLIGGELLAQVPQSFQYQAVARNSNRNLISNQNIGVKISITDDPDISNATFTYSETHNTNTNSYGLFSIKVGTGTPTGTKVFSDIDWVTGVWFLRIEIDSLGGTSYVEIGNEVRIGSVPFSLYAEEAGSLSGPIDIALDDLTDVSTQGLSNEKVLKYNGTTWVAGNDLKDDADADPTNEIQTLSISGSDLAISSGNSVTIPGVPPGTMMMFCGPASNVPAGWLVCDGGQYTQTQHPELFMAIGTAWGGSGGSFNVPDMRGRFPRGTDDGQGRDPDAAVRVASNAGGNTGDAVGSLQDDRFQGHYHRVDFFDTFGTTGVRPITGPIDREPGPNASVNAPPTPSLAGATDIVDDQAYGSVRVSSETRPQNVNVIYIVKE